AACTTLLRNVTYSVTHQVHLPSWFADFKMIAVPSCPDGHTFSNMLPSTRTRRAFFNSNAFFAATPDVRHDSRFVLRFRRISMSDGTRSLIAGSLPPKMMFSLAASRELFAILNG